MPKKPAVPHPLLLEAIINSEDVIDGEGKIPGKSHKVWAEVAAHPHVNNLLKPDYIHLYVLENRHGSLDALCKARGITAVSGQQKKIEDNSSDSENDSEEGSDRGVKTFEIVISPDKWQKMKPIEKSYPRRDRPGIRNVRILPPFQWEDIIINCLWEQYRLPCPYSFNHSQVYSSYGSEHFISVYAFCRECGTKAEGHIASPPMQGESAVMQWTCNDTRSVKHSSKRYLRGETRVKVAAELQGKSSSSYRKVMAERTMNQGDQEPPNMWKPSVLRQAKLEAKNKILQVPQGTNAIDNIVIMKYSEPYAGKIHDIGRDKFFVHYYSPAQMEVYRLICKHNRGYVVLCIDATGSLVLGILTPLGKSRHIMLFEAVLSTDKFQLPVTQMLSEKQDANSILYWLNEWHRSGAPCPDEVICDNSNAIKSAIVRAFCRCADTAEYKQKCFDFLQKGTDLPPCYLRLDAAHYLNAAGKWDVWKTALGRRVKKFYMHILGLLMVQKSLTQFAILFKHTMYLALSAYEDEVEEGGISKLEASRRYLTEKLSGIDPPDELPEEMESNAEVDDPDSQDDEMTKGQCTDINDYIDALTKEVEDDLPNVNDSGNMNPYYLPDVQKKFNACARDFVLWTAVLVDGFGSPNLSATSAPVESDFADLKVNILRGEKTPMRVDKFLATHLQAIEGACRIAGAELISEPPEDASIIDEPPEDACTIDEPHGSDNGASSGAQNTITNKDRPSGSVSNSPENSTLHNTGSNIPSSKPADSEPVSESGTNEHGPGDLNSIENWRGLSLFQKRSSRRSLYLNPSPEMALAIANEKMKPPKKIVLLNGNLTGFVEVDGGNHIEISNTCAFDCLVQLVSSAYIHYSNYRQFVNSSQSSILQTAKSLALNGAVARTLKLRAETLSTILDPRGALPSVKLRSHRKTTLRLQFDCWNGVEVIGKRLLKEDPSVKFKFNCLAPSQSCSGDGQLELISPNYELLSQDTSSLEESIMSSLPKCMNAACTSSITEPDFGNHLFIDVDVFSEPTSAGAFQCHTCPLDNIPVFIKLTGKNYVLAGLVSRIPAHFVAMTRSVEGHWRLFNNLKEQSPSVRKTEKVSPVILFYVKY